MSPVVHLVQWLESWDYIIGSLHVLSRLCTNYEPRCRVEAGRCWHARHIDMMAETFRQ